ncbi:hypothetical protein IE81DRAFT_325920 [Ceraceosorus guamensis]|uniref:Vps52-domain-containing protein n=1 Tax=Ceraceosorus guamensis TaxID=1522189 RepID=A0A316VSR1_9BASI|nr:hypothetical protein IE81DRAFT_325920 [Ceraceosorus guamensis]PWN40078.1 hypothetical protein IE81DRAFT_325920 [Ceraceosorus guamensis]
MAAVASSSRASPPDRSQQQHRPTNSRILGDITAEPLLVAASTGSDKPLQALHAQNLAQSSLHTQEVQAHFLNQAPKFVELHNTLSTSLSQLESLSSFLSTFSADLGAVSSHISTLQARSQELERRLVARRKLELPLNDLVQSISISPETLKHILDEEPNKDWQGYLAEVEKVLDASSSAAAASLLSKKENTASTQGNIVSDGEALEEVRKIAEGAKMVAAAKLRGSLLAPLQPIKRSLTANLTLLQSLLLRSHRGLYGFLARQMPRVAIDVQREYVGLARLYYETGFRRYERALKYAREKARRRESRAAVLIAEVMPPGATGAGPDAEGDTWLLDTLRLEHAKMADGPPVCLAYQAEDPTMRHPIESLFRSLSLVMLDNASAEYCFIARFFEDLESMPVKPSKTLEDLSDDGPEPEESASAAGDAEEASETAKTSIGGGGGTMREEAHGDVTHLSKREQQAMQGRAAGADELWRQVMEPVLGHWTTFVKSLLAPSPPSMLSLLTVLQHLEGLLSESTARGVSRVLQPTLMNFKMEAYPVLQRQWDEHIASIKKFADTGTPQSGGVLTSANVGTETIAAGFGSFVRAAANTVSNPFGSQDPRVTDQHVVTVSYRYGRLYSSVVSLTMSEEFPDAASSNPALFSSLLRLRAEVERLIEKQVERISKRKASGTADDASGPNAAGLLAMSSVTAVKRALENGPAALSHPRLQTEMSHWSETERSRRLG